MTTSGFTWAIHFFDGSYPWNTGAQYGSCVRLLSIATPMAGTCDVATPATILATCVGVPLRLEAISVGRTTALQHHLGVVLLAHARHRRGYLLERQPVGRTELGSEIDIAAELDHAVPVAVQDRLLLFRSHWESGEVTSFI